MLLEPDRYRHTPLIAPERTHAPGKRQRARDEGAAKGGEATRTPESADERGRHER